VAQYVEVNPSRHRKILWEALRVVDIDEYAEYMVCFVPELVYASTWPSSSGPAAEAPSM
jgi:hypothetical protein|tara:strand:- start:674 stop:850 length:177 start_codon:yes stop_codon:yes gene_type:complete